MSSAAAGRKQKLHIYWKPHEYALVVQRARELGPPERGDSPEVWRRMQEGLPPERHRAFDPATMSKINAERRKGRLSIPKPPPLTAVVAPAAVVEPLPTAKEEPEQGGVEQLIVQCLLKVLYDPDLRAAARDLVAEVLAPENEEELRSAVTFRKPIPGRAKLLRIAIVGAGGSMHAQLQNIENASVRFWMGLGESRHKLKAMLQHADLAVVFVKLCEHSAMQMVKDWERHRRRKVIYWHQGANELRTVLEKEAKELNQPKGESK